jgi:UDPglucose 6-dehydrogenase
MVRKKKIAIIGNGYVGLSFAAILSNVGYKVYALDIDEEKIKKIKGGNAHFAEKGLDDLIKKGLEKALLIPTTSYEDYLPLADIVFSCVGTPDREDGSCNLDYVFDVGSIVANLCKDGVIFVQKSTVPVGTGRKLMESISKENPKLKYSYVSNPEFLAEGSAVYDTFMMDRVVLGSDDSKAIDSVMGLYKSIYEGSKSFDIEGVSEFAHVYRAVQNNNHHFNVVKTTLESAELIKVTSNALLSLKISFANSIALLCEKTGADINEVMDGVGMDKRIGRSFLYAGRGYGGGCFPKDVSGLISIADEKGVDLEIMKASVRTNDRMVEEIVTKLKKRVGDLKGKKISLLGLSFKPGTSDIRKSPALKLARSLISEGAFIIAYDPEAMEETKGEMGDSLVYAKSTKDALTDTDFVVIATEWPEFVDFDFGKHVDNIKEKFIVDCQNRLDKTQIKNQGFEYMGVGRN